MSYSRRLFVFKAEHLVDNICTMIKMSNLLSTFSGATKTFECSSKHPKQGHRIMEGLKLVFFLSFLKYYLN